MVLKQIITRNIQNHREVVIDLPEHGLIVFTGNNSNGKSVIVKTTLKMLNGDITKPRKRASLVNRNATFGEIIYVRNDDVVLTMHLAREAAATFIKYEEPGKEPIVRYLSDKSYKELIKDFGWHYDDTSGISLNIAEEEDALLFYKTSNKINCSILETATCDTRANKVAESFEQTLKDARSFRDQAVAQIRTYSSALQDLRVEPVQPLIEKREKLAYCYRNLNAVYIPSIPDIEPVPIVHFADVYSPNLPEIKYPRIISLSCDIPDILGVAEELRVLNEHRCPMCGRGFNCDC